jgi:hypothetical protein
VTLAVTLVGVACLVVVINFLLDVAEVGKEAVEINNGGWEPLHVN